MQNDISDILFSAFKDTFVKKGFICFPDISIYKEFSGHEFIKKKKKMKQLLIKLTISNSI